MIIADVKDKKKKIMDFIREKGGATIPELQTEYAYSYAEASFLINSLLEEKKIELSEDETHYVWAVSVGKTTEPPKEESLGKGRFDSFTTPRPRSEETPFAGQGDVRFLYWKIVREIGKGVNPKRMGRNAWFDLGICYPDDTRYCITLVERGNSFVIDDRGKTAEYLRKKMLPTVDEKLLEEKINSVIKEYNITFEEDCLTTEVNTETDALPAFLFLFSAIERLTKLDMKA